MYRVQLQNFEGPLDLLLFFIKRDELDVYDIPIAYITDQFLEYIHFLEELDLNIASEFILMASTLMAIKAKMMIPQVQEEEELDPEEDPRYELVQALLEYKKYKEMAEELIVYDQLAQKTYTRNYFETDKVEFEPETGEILKDITLFDLISALKQVMLQERKEPPKHHVQRFETTIEQQSTFIYNQLLRRGRTSFLQLCIELQTRISVIVTFLAVLELVKERKLLLMIDQKPTDFYLELNTEIEFYSNGDTLTLNTNR